MVEVVNDAAAVAGFLSLLGVLVKIAAICGERQCNRHERWGCSCDDLTGGPRSGPTILEVWQAMRSEGNTEISRKLARVIVRAVFRGALWYVFPITKTINLLLYRAPRTTVMLLRDAVSAHAPALTTGKPTKENGQLSVTPHASGSLSLQEDDSHD